MLKEKIIKLLPSCCDVGFLSMHNCSEDEQVLTKELLPSTKTIIVLAHHIKSSLEWAWFPLESERNNITCGADLHAKNVLGKIELAVNEDGFLSYSVAYPGRCGIRMKDFASKTNLGTMGDNYLFLHLKWGAWTHLRLLLTNADITDNQSKTTNVCIHCGKCLEACPAKAIKKDTFDGIACGNYQSSTWNSINDNYYWKCEVCARICPIGQTPLPIKIIKDEPSL